MLTLPLEPTDDRADPIFRDAAGCERWLSQLQLTNLQQAQGRLISQLDELNACPMRAADRLAILELLQETVAHVQGELARKLADKPLPLADTELKALQLIARLWAAMNTGYQRCLQAQMSGEIAAAGALLCQRCLHYGGLELLEYLRAGYEPDRKLWRALHELYAHAEAQDWQLTEAGGQNCTASYATTLLAAYANPAQLSRWQYLQMARWLAAWSGVATIDDNYTKSKSDAQPLAIDLSGSSGLQQTEGLQHHGAMRYLAMVPVSKLLRVKTILLQQGQTPQQVGLGDHPDGAACLELLNHLHRIWCDSGHKRVATRRTAGIETELSSGLDGIFAHLTGTPFKGTGLDSLALKQIQTLGYAQGSRNMADMGYPLENWQIVNESAVGAGLVRGDDNGARFRCRQLIAHRPGNSPYFMLAAIAWVRIAQTGRLQMGLRYLPGRPEALRIHVPSINPSVSSIYAPAFLLPEFPAIRTPASLIVPRDWFIPRRIIELARPDGSVTRVEMGFSVERGLDYERISFTIKG